MIALNNVIQGTDEWLLLRCGIPTASCFDKIITTKGDSSKQAKAYLYQLAGERVTEAKTETYHNSVMQKGTELEEEARALFQMVKTEIEQVGICYPDEQKRYACSPDGLSTDAGLEIKCPLIHTHVEYLLNRALPTAYIQQIQGSMLVTGFTHYWFMSYFPGLPPLILDIQRDYKFTAALAVALKEFCDSLDSITARLRELA